MAKRQRRQRVWLTDDVVDADLRIEAEELASQREGTMLPGHAAVRKAMRDILTERRSRRARADAIAAGFEADLSEGDE